MVFWIQARQDDKQQKIYTENEEEKVWYLFLNVMNNGNTDEA